ncbi:MAG: O-antigen ligase family protein [Nitrospira sp.]|nr:O-antigen ligase family protein [Nitrospira sp.]
MTLQSSFADPQILGIYMLMAYCLYCLMRQPGSLRYAFASPLWPLTIFTVVAFASAVVISRAPMYSLWRSAETSVVLLWAALVFSHLKREQSPIKLFVAYYAMSAIMLVAVLVAVVIDPQNAWIHEQHKVDRLETSSTFMMAANTIGVMAALIALATLARFILLTKVRYLALSLAALAICYGARSRTGFIVFVLGLLVLTGFLLRMPRRRGIASIVGGLAGVLIVGLLLVSPEFTDSVVHTFTRGHSEANIRSLDGRVPLWTEGLKAFEQYPILGAGYGTYPVRLVGRGHFHNMFLELAVTTGVLGLLPILILLGIIGTRLGKLLLRNHNYDGAISHSINLLDVLLIATVVIVSQMSTAAAAYYSWQMIGIVVLAVGLFAIPDTYVTNDGDSNCVPSVVATQSTSSTLQNHQSFEVQKHPIIL